MKRIQSVLLMLFVGAVLLGCTSMNTADDSASVLSLHREREGLIPTYSYFPLDYQVNSLRYDNLCDVIDTYMEAIGYNGESLERSNYIVSFHYEVTQSGAYLIIFFIDESPRLASDEFEPRRIFEASAYYDGYRYGLGDRIYERLITSIFADFPGENGIERNVRIDNIIQTNN